MIVIVNSLSTVMGVSCKTYFSFCWVPELPNGMNFLFAVVRDEFPLCCSYMLKFVNVKRMYHIKIQLKSSFGFYEYTLMRLTLYILSAICD